MLAGRVRGEILAEIDSLQSLVVELKNAPLGDESWAVRARGSIIHDFYTGVERIFVRIADELNGGVPSGRNWHRQLLRDMTIPIENLRPAVISTKTADRLSDFLGFRHLFRNIYGSLLEPDRLAPLQESLEKTFADLVADLTKFTDWLIDIRSD